MVFDIRVEQNKIIPLTLSFLVLFFHLPEENLYTFISAKVSYEMMIKLNPYVVKDICGYTYLHLDLKGHQMVSASYLVDIYRRALFLANKDGMN